MKIGILTHPFHYNYGGILQAWALQYILKEMGHEPVKIDWYGPRQSMNAKTFITLSLSWFKTLSAKVIGLRRYVALVSPYNHIFRHDQVRCIDRRFIKRIGSTPRIYDREELYKIIAGSDFDAFIVGSDQVWRQVYCNDIEIFFLGFLHASDHRRRIAYAASFGTTEPDIEVVNMASCRELLQRFDSVSVREKSGVDIIRNYFNRHDVSQVLDPTLLLDANVYMQLVDDNVLSKDKSFISAYILDPTSEKKSILEDLSVSLGLKVKKTTCNPGNGLDMPPVAQWIANFAQSDFVITDSFHGCVFAIIFRKTFIAIGNEWRGLDRFLSLLNSFGLKDRLVESHNDYEVHKAELLSPIDYNTVYRKLEVLREYSMKFLKDALA